MKIHFNYKNHPPLFVLDMDDFLLQTASERIEAFKKAVMDNAEKYKKLGLDDLDRFCTLIEGIKGKIKGSEFDSYLKKEEKGITKILAEEYGQSFNKVIVDGQACIADKQAGSTYRFDLSNNPILEELYKDATATESSWIEMLANGQMPTNSNNEPIFKFMPGAFEFLQTIYQGGADVILWSFGFGEYQQKIWHGTVKYWAAKYGAPKSVTTKMLEQKIFGRENYDNPDQSTEKPNLAKLEKAAAESAITIDTDTKIFLGDDSARSAKAIIAIAKMLKQVPENLLFVLTAPMHSNQPLLLDDDAKLSCVKKVLHDMLISPKFSKNEITKAKFIELFLTAAHKTHAAVNDDMLTELANYEIDSFIKMRSELQKSLTKAVKDSDFAIEDFALLTHQHIVVVDPWLVGLNDAVFDQGQITEFLGCSTEESKDASVYLGDGL